MFQNKLLMEDGIFGGRHRSSWCKNLNGGGRHRSSWCKNLNGGADEGEHDNLLFTHNIQINVHICAPFSRICYL
jgi:hypothetical protein